MFNRPTPAVPSYSTVDRRTNPAIGQEKSVSGPAIGQSSISQRLPRLRLDENDAVFKTETSSPAPTNHVRASNIPIIPLNVQTTLSLSRVQPITSRAPPTYADSNAPRSLPVAAKVPPIGTQAPPTYANLVRDPAATAVKPLKESNGALQNPPPSPTKTAEKSEIRDPPKLTRGFSRALINQPIVSLARDRVIRDVAVSSEGRGASGGRGGQDGRGREGGSRGEEEGTEGACRYSFVLPDLSGCPEDLRAFLCKDLIETSTLVSLEQDGDLNWWADIGACHRLMPMVTSGDGNCLLHAASLAMWGFHDRLLSLRGALWGAMQPSSPVREGLRRRWRWAAALTHRQCGLELSEEEWDAEWEGVVRLASPQPRGGGGGEGTGQRGGSVMGNRAEHQTAGGMAAAGGRTPDYDYGAIYESLEEVHVFVLAHVLRRPIIVVAKAMLRGVAGDDLAPIPFGGIYLPLEREPHECHRTPLMLTYDAAHFCALVPVDQGEGPGTKGGEGGVEKPGQPLDAIPLVRPDLSLLPIHFLIDPDGDTDFDRVLKRASLSLEDKLELLREFLDVVFIPPSSDQIRSAPVAGAAGISGPRVRRTDSGRSGGSGGGGGKEGKGRVTIVGMAKSIGNLGQNLSRAVKGVGTGSGGGGKEPKLVRRTSIGMVTQCTRRTSDTLDALSEDSPTGTQIICASLRQRAAGPHSAAFVQNYIAAATERFRDEQDRRRDRHTEIRRLSVAGGLRPVSVPAYTRIDDPRGFPAIAGKFPPNGNFDDVGKYPNQFSTLPNQLNRGGVVRYDDYVTAYDARNGGESYRVLGASGQPQPNLARQNTLLATGKSKFYMTTAEDHCLSPNTENRLFADTLNRRKQAAGVYRITEVKPASFSDSTLLPRPLAKANSDFAARSTPFFQNSGAPGNYGGFGPPSGANSIGRVLVQGGVGGRCVTPGCGFHGTPDREGLCSACYQRRESYRTIFSSGQTKL